MNTRKISFLVAPCVLLLMVVERAGAQTSTNHDAHPSGLDPRVLLGVGVILLVAKLGGEVFERLKQPAVLGELLGGIVVGNLALAGFNAAESLKSDLVIGALAEIGVILLLFEVGLESNLDEMLEVGWSALLAALAGTTATFFLGWGVAAYFLPQLPRLAHLFIGAALCATSVGITARVLSDMKKLHTREARIILGAAITDDILGLLVLAVMVGAVKSFGTSSAISAWSIILIAAKAVSFIAGAIILGRFVVRQLFRGVSRFAVRGLLLSVCIAFCFLMAWAASKADLAPIIGAFAAGLVLDEAQFKLLPRHGKQDLQQLLAPVSTLFVPIFFVMVGLRVDLRALLRLDFLGFALALALAAILGKQFCSLAVVERKVKRLAVGFGMMPRGEVELIFAGLGATLMLPSAGGASGPVIGAQTYAAIVLTVIVTTLATPPALKWAMKRG